MAAGDHAEGFVQICGQFLKIPGLPGVVAGGGNAAGQLAGVFKAGNVVPLPAMHGNFYIRELFKGFLGIDPLPCVKLLGVFVIIGHNILPPFSVQNKLRLGADFLDGKGRRHRFPGILRPGVFPGRNHLGQDIAQGGSLGRAGINCFAGDFCSQLV